MPMTSAWPKSGIPGTWTTPSAPRHHRRSEPQGHQAGRAAHRPADAPWFWKGPAWYQREVTIPDSWSGKRISLFLERTKNTRVWVDDTFCGWDDTLSAPQVFDVTQAMAPGKHTITLLIDNAKLPPVGPSHHAWTSARKRTGTASSDASNCAPPTRSGSTMSRSIRTLERNRRSSGSASGTSPVTWPHGEIEVTCSSTNVENPSRLKGAAASKFAGINSESAIEFTCQRLVRMSRCGTSSGLRMLRLTRSRAQRHRRR
jgi:hypothetical protein